MPVLDDDKRDQLFTVVRDLAITDGTWVDALSALLPAYRQGLPDAAAPGTRLYQTLVALNQSGHLIDGTLPIEVVLTKLRLLTSQARMSELTTALLGEVSGERRMATAPAYDPGGKLEAYTGTSDDMLPFDFLIRGVAVGRSVVKLLVPRFENGQRAVGSQGPRSFVGTGWVIAPGLIATNFHVICARESHEPDPSPADLNAQIQGTVCQFDYDREHAAGTGVAVMAGAAWGARGGARDYALLRLADSTSPPALRLRRQPPSVPPEGFAVNIIQHPAGMPKRVAARANLLKAASTDVLEYFSDTLGGSSGSPLCNDSWEVIGLHRASGPTTQVMIRGKPAAAYNQGIPIDAILSDIKATQPALFTELSASIIA
jgi:endonuclease G, mitochondrial